MHVYHASVKLHKPSGLVNRSTARNQIQESCAVARKPRDAAYVLLGLKFADNVRYKFKSTVSKVRLGVERV